MKIGFAGGALWLTAALSWTASARAGESLEDKLHELRDRYENGSRDAREFEIQESEANDYLRQQGGSGSFEGIESPWIRFEEDLAVLGATVDLDRFKARAPDSIVLQLLSGRVPVEIRTRISGDKGVGRLILQKVLVGGMELPSSVLAAMSRSEGASKFLPPGFRLGEPFDLPFDLESIHCRVGAVSLKQGPSALTK